MPDAQAPVTPEAAAPHNEDDKLLLDGAGHKVQIAKYIHGIGDSSNALVRFLGGTFGMGAIGGVIRGYTFLSRNYQAGDAIYLVGFSRGAYTVRALGGIIAKVGLLNPRSYDAENKAEAYQLGIAAWAKATSISLEAAGKLTDPARAKLGFVQGIVAKRLPTDGLLPYVPVKAVAVWETVGTMGIAQHGDDNRLDVFRFVDTELSDKVEHGFRAMAIDELRIDFPVTRWDDRRNVEQVWFVGAHADVGGGYPITESRLSDVALSWMMRKLADVDVRFAAPLTYCPRPQAVGPMIHTPWRNGPFASLQTAARQVGGKDVLHESVVQRWDTDSAYRPLAMAAFSARGLATFTIDRGWYGETDAPRQ